MLSVFRIGASWGGLRAYLPKPLTPAMRTHPTGLPDGTSCAYMQVRRPRGLAS